MATCLVVLAGCGNANDRLAVALVTPSPDVDATRAAAVHHIYTLAKAHATRDLSALRSEDQQPSPAPAGAMGLDSAVTLALYTIDPTTYAHAFVDGYPGDRRSLAVDYGTAFAAARIERDGVLFPIRSLGALARAGDPDAYVKLLGALPVTDGPLGDAYRTEANAAVARLPAAATIGAFAALPPATRLGAVARIAWCGRPSAALLAYRPTPAPSVTPTVAATRTAAGSPSPAASDAGARASPTPSPSPTASPTPRPTRAPPSARSVADVQAAIASSARLDCAVARAEAVRSPRRRPAHRRASADARTANSKKRAAATRTR